MNYLYIVLFLCCTFVSENVFLFMFFFEEAFFFLCYWKVAQMMVYVCWRFSHDFEVSPRCL